VRTRPHDQYKFDCVLPFLACVIDCVCKDKPSWQGYSCVTGDNQQSSGVVIARSPSLGALDHQHRDLYTIKFIVPLGRSDLILLSSSINYQVAYEV
jgi:hypothetical protein